MSTHIEWTDETWNPTTGCDRVSPGCDNCYIERTIPFRIEGRRFDENGRMGVRLHPDRLDKPLHWRKPRRVFVNSLSDLFHPAINPHFIGSVWNTMALCPQHVFQILTKRPQTMFGRVQAWADNGWLWRRHDLMWCGPIDGPLPNVWLGVSIESDRYTWRADWLRKTPATVRWLSLEPLLGPLPSLSLEGIDWVVVGGESGLGARHMQLDWVDDIIAACRAAGVAVFVKQLGSAYSQAGDPKGGKPEYWPPELRIREYPAVAP